VRLKSLYLWGLFAVTGIGLYASPPATGAKFWSTDPNLDCSAAHALAIQVQLASGGLGTSCLVSGTFVWDGRGWRVEFFDPRSGTRVRPDCRRLRFLAGWQSHFDGRHFG